MKALILILLFSTTFVACQPSKSTDTNQRNTPVNNPQANEPFSYINPKGTTVQTRFKLPEGFSRTLCDSNSFGHYLRELPLKEHGSVVHLFDGTVKVNNSTYLAVIDLPIRGNKDHQCADAVMRLRAEYLFSKQLYSKIEFLFVSGKTSKYLNYLNGKTPNENNLWKYMCHTFAFANTYSLDKQLKSKGMNDLDIGDIFIIGGFPGHAIIVVDKCINQEGKVKFMLAQSYMPAQEIQILDNPANPGCPWYDLDFGQTLVTPDWDFTASQLKSFE
jgi:hypothetical protein